MVSFKLIDNESNNAAFMRSRHRVKNYVYTFHSDDDNKSADGKYHGKVRRRRITVGKLFIMIVLVSLISAFYLRAIDHRHGSSASVSQPNPKANNDEITQSNSNDVATKKDWSNCAKAPLQPKLKNKVDKKVEPLWLPAYPTSLPIEQYAKFIATLTGIRDGAKTYYRQSPSLKRCHYKNSNDFVQAVTCESVHRG